MQSNSSHSTHSSGDGSSSPPVPARWLASSASSPVESSLVWMTAILRRSFWLALLVVGLLCGSILAMPRPPSVSRVGVTACETAEVSLLLDSELSLSVSGIEVRDARRVWAKGRCLVQTSGARQFPVSLFCGELWDTPCVTRRRRQLRARRGVRDGRGPVVLFVRLLEFHRRHLYLVVDSRQPKKSVRHLRRRVGWRRSLGSRSLDVDRDARGERSGRSARRRIQFIR